jgi:hypothetical protein
MNTWKARLFLVAALAAALLMANSQSALAQAPNNPVGLWSLSAYNDNTPNLAFMATQRICFLANGTWFSPTFAGWGGRWFQKGNNAAGNGNRVRIAGNYANGVGNDSAEVDFIHLRLMTGPWTEWRDAFPFLAWARVTLTRIGNCVAPAAAFEGSMTEAAVQDDGTNPIETGDEAPVCLDGR